MQEHSVIEHALKQILLQIPVLLAAGIGFLLLIRNQGSIGPAIKSASAGLAMILVLAIFGPFYHGWVTKLIIQQGADANRILFFLSPIVMNLFWGISILLLVISIFMGRAKVHSSENVV